MHWCMGYYGIIIPHALTSDPPLPPQTSEQFGNQPIFTRKTKYRTVNNLLIEIKSTSIIIENNYFEIDNGLSHGGGRRPRSGRRSRVLSHGGGRCHRSGGGRRWKGGRRSQGLSHGGRRHRSGQTATAADVEDVIGAARRRRRQTWKTS